MKLSKKILAPILLTLGLIAFVANQNQVEASSEATDATVEWNTDYEAARELAVSEGKPLLLEFTGSDWCPPCMQMKKEVFSQGPFINYASENLVLVKLDFPRGKEQSEALKKQNQELANEFGVTGFPTILILDTEGKVLHSDVGFQPGGAASYVEKLKGVIAAK